MEVDDNQENNNSEVRRNPLERKSCYRNLLNKAEAIQETENVGIQTVNEVGEILREANTLDTEVEIEERVGNADETLLDCLVLSSASGILKRCIEAVDVFTSTYDSAEFAAKVILSIKPEEGEETELTDILKLLDDARKVIPNVPDYNYVYGSYDLSKLPVPRQKKERQKVAKEKLQKKEPEKIVNLDKEEEGIEEIVEILYDVLSEAYSRNKGEPINYYDYIIDTDSYPNTIENMFYFAFLIRDGRAHIDLDKGGSPVIKSMKKKDLKAFRDDGGKNTQIISCISMDTWEKFGKPGLLQKHKKKTKL